MRLELGINLTFLDSLFVARLAKRSGEKEKALCRISCFIFLLLLVYWSQRKEKKKLIFSFLIFSFHQIEISFPRLISFSFDHCELNN